VTPRELSDDTKAILLLCGRFDPREDAAPLTVSELNRLEAWLGQQGFRPADLVDGPALARLGANPPLKLDPRRVEELLARGPAMALAIEQWRNKGMWILCRGEESYPPRLRAHLGKQAPPILHGFGDASLLDAGGLAVVGSRDVDEIGSNWAESIARRAAGEGLTVISGAARGVDQIAMRASLDEGGSAVGVLADNLLPTVLRPDVRDALRSGRLVLISPYHPAAGFSIGNAMGRNKLIYGLADWACVVSAEVQKGGTWAGAEEELRRRPHVPVFVRLGDGVPAGNRELLALGALPFPPAPWTSPFTELLSSAGSGSPASPNPTRQRSLFDSLEHEP